ncbi:MAG TPA: DUF4124 domain-containing protein [Pelomicrobium sp.]|nr:DUF4124 domain-containing protein [Pelomicrobium sp.]
MLTRSMRFAIAAALLLAGGAALAQTVYRSTMPDGRVIFGDAPAPGATRVEEVRVQPAPTVAPPATREQVQRAQENAAERTEQRRDAQQRLEEARNELSRAEAALANGTEPLPGERLGTAGGGSRLSDDYWARQQRLKDAVAEAKQKIEAAQAELNALR